ncbi:ATP-binding protein [Streptomyces sp. NRRL S-350]|uniref:ATP-binding protein n=1 Tax=Streptomyces sp. NRRL S-350 TaxID=1463902 RepID=UPI00068DAD87|nr:ATP-binding protein [Streptomyces sp. NRRL S-350]
MPTTTNEPEQLVPASKAAVHTRAADGTCDADCPAWPCNVEVDANLEIETGQTAVPAARRSLKELVKDHELPADERLDDALLCLSELLTNARRHAGTVLRVRVTWTREGHLRVDVQDNSLRLPQQRKHNKGSQGGRGLHLVSELADAWGWYPAGAGKVVWFHVTVGQLRTEQQREQRLTAMVRRSRALAQREAGQAAVSRPARVHPLPRRTPGLGWGEFVRGGQTGRKSA